MILVTWERKPLADRPPRSRSKPCCAAATTSGRHVLIAKVKRKFQSKGKTRISLVLQPPTLNSCCLADPMRRAAWWEETERILGSYAGMHGTDCEVKGFDRKAARVVAGKLVKVVPMPTTIELGDYYALRAREQREFEARVAPLKAALMGRFDHPGIRVIEVEETSNISSQHDGGIV